MTIAVAPLRNALIATFLVLLSSAALAQDAGPAADAPAAEPAASETADTAPQSQTARLLEILKDDAARAALIDELERAAAAPGDAPAAGDQTPQQEPPASIGRQLALFTQAIAENTAQQLERGWHSLTGAKRVFASLGTDQVKVLIDALRDLLLVIAITVAIFLTLRWLMKPVYRRMGRHASNSNLVHTAFLFTGSVLLDMLIVIAAWGIGTVIAVLVFGQFGAIGLRQTLYLNAFLVVETIKVAVRAVLSPVASGLRPLPLSDGAARALNRSANIVISVLGYGQLLVVPIINANATYLAGRSMSALILLFVLAYLVTLVLRRRGPVSRWLMTRISPPQPVLDADGQPTGEMAPSQRRPSRLVRTLAQSWHWFALAYLAVMFFIVLTRPATAVFAAVFASVEIVLAVVVASLVSAMIAKAIVRGVSLPESLNARLPMLERRLNRLIPYFLIAVRIAIGVALILFALDVIGAIDVAGWLGTDLGLRFTGTTASVTLILVMALAFWLAMTSWVDYRLNRDPLTAPTARETTLLSLLRNAVTIVLVVLTLMFCLSEIGIDIGPLLASAGVLGLAIGFGAQKMVQDIITGVFIQFENAVNVGDVVTLAGTSGVVEKLTVRSVSLRDLNGVFHVIPFSSVDMVSNFTRGFGYFVADMGVAYREDITEAKQAMFDAFEELRQNPEHAASIVGDFEWFGLNSFGASEIILRGRIKTLPGKQWGIGRAYNEIVKRIFDDRGIEIPFPHQTIYFGERKDGSTQTLHVASEGE
ncbi:mechanosensitive ion channel domain-containing protein [Rhodobium gokarnense]|uniref:Small-conductance mechanosensitive channel n=1 Tax=Rhodobium gokarnense TaxID=364296 RepID=A0ABT3H8M5_9HYPH|nr:mechanosensitive ion channel domain-containing protein [Rhodobium gokarnense]MCW2306752.1 small-conductance mechanosensitive channel [Rhodobium gokarnense]